MKLWNVKNGRLNKCYYCVCTVCNLARCPHGHDRFHHCEMLCYRHNRRIPILDCEFFEHVERRKVYRIKRSGKAEKRYSNAQIGAMLEAVMLRLNVEAAEASGDYEILYCGAVVAVRKTYSEAEEYAQQFRQMEKVKIRKRVV